MLPLAEQRLFMARLRPYWEVLRHRSAAESLDAIADWRASGRVEVLAGAVCSVRERDGLEVELAPRGGGGPLRRRFDRLILCTGPQTDVRCWPGALFRQLLGQGLLRADPLGLGVQTDACGRALDEHGEPSPWLFTIGALRRPRLWETTFVPDIVRQAATLAEALTSGSALAAAE